MKKLYKYVMCTAVAIMAVGCIDHVPVAEELPSKNVAFVYEDIDDTYPLDYYVDSDIKFTSIAYLKGSATWNFGDGTPEETGDSVIHVFTTAGTYTVRLTINTADGKTEFCENSIMISDIKPLMKINPFDTEVCEVNNTTVSFSVELPNPKNRVEAYKWIFPEGTKLKDGTIIETCEDKIPAELHFSNVGSQTVQLIASLDGRVLETAAINVQVGYSKPVPTLYYSVYGGNIMALKLVDNAPSGMKIMPFDLAIASGQHPFNILFNDTSLYILDAGKQFYYIDDADKVLGDGNIRVITKDGSKVETVMSNVGQWAMEDPFFGCIDGEYIYFGDRNVGMSRIKMSERNKMYVESEHQYVGHNYIGYYGNGFAYGSIFGGIGKWDGIWHWSKVYNGTGLFRFKDSDILTSYNSGGQPAPESGIALGGMHPKALAFDKKNNKFFFTLWDDGYQGVYMCDGLNGVDAIGTSKSALPAYKLAHKDGLTFDLVDLGSHTSLAPKESTYSEPVYICQLAVDEATGNVYFGFRNTTGLDSDCKSGLYRYNASTGKIETVLTGVEIYGVAINNAPSKLF